MKNSPESGVEAIKGPLFQRVRGLIESEQMLLFKDRPEGRENALRRLTPDAFNVAVFHEPILSQRGEPLITIGIKESEKGKHDGVHLQILSDEEKEALWGGVSPADFSVLCEDSALWQIEEYERLLRDTPAEELDRDFNGAHTYRSLYQMMLGWARQTLAWVKRQSPIQLKEHIQYF